MLVLKNYIVVTRVGIDVPLSEVFIKVKAINGNQGGMEISVSLLFNEKEIETKYFNFIPDLGGDNFIKQAYLYLKTLPEFADAIDC